VKKSLPARIYRKTADFVEPLLPRSLVTPAHYLARQATKRFEAEHELVMSMARAGTTAVDVGANLGIYTYGFLLRGANVVAIEPQPELADIIRAFYRRGLPRSRHGATLEVHAEALGDSTGDAVLHIPLKNGKVDHESASLAKDLSSSLGITVPVRRLDDFNLKDVSVIKMDVEGNEIASLSGASETIRQWRPSILVEIEQRHHKEPLSLVFSMIESIAGPGYAIQFLRDGQLRGLSDFDVERDQLSLVDNPHSSRYVRNFFILPE
jgi:FkbM family methyltransferase